MDLISSVAGALNIIEKISRIFRKNGTVEVIPKAQKIGNTPDKLAPYFVVHIINNDSVNLEIVGIGYILNKRVEKNFVERFNLPEIVAPGRSHMFVFDPQETLLDHPKKIWVIDQRHRTYYSRRLKTKNALKQLEKLAINSWKIPKKTA